MTDQSLLKGLKKRAVKVLKDNDTGNSTKPALLLYPHQWNWDSAFIAIGLSHIDEERAQQEILSLLRGQWTNGMIPHIIFNPHYAKYFPNSAFWNTSACFSGAPKTVQTSGITQPPILASATYAVFKNSGNKKKAIAFLKKVFPALKKYYRFFLTYRDPMEEGLAYIIHPWESGLDNSPRWDEVLSNIKMKWTPKYERVDNKIISPEQRPSDQEYDKYTYLVELFRDVNYDSNRIWDENPFIVQPILLNCLLYESTQSLKEICKILDEDTAEIEQWTLKIRNGINNKLWDKNLKMYCDFDLKNSRLIRKETIASFTPLYAGIPSQGIADLLVNTLMLPTQYWPTDGYPLTSVSMSAPEFDPKKYWRGPVWININWLMIKGLQRYGYYEESRHLIEKTIGLVLKSGFYEYFDPFTGKGYGSDKFSWSASLIIDLLETYGEY